MPSPLTGRTVFLGVATVLLSGAAAGEPPAETLGSALAGGELVIQARVFGLNRLFEGDQVLVPRVRQRGAAAGGWAEYSSRPWRGLSLGLGASTSQPLSDGAQAAGTRLLNAHGDGYSVVHLAFVQTDLGGLTLRAFRQKLTTPLLASLDNRMTPITFEAITAEGRISGDLTFLASHVTGMKWQNDTSFTSPSEAAGLDMHEPVTLAGVNWTPARGVTLRAWDFYLPDVMNAPYLQLDAAGDAGRGWTLTASLQAMAQFPVGRAPAEDSSTGFAGIQLALRRPGIELRAAFADVSRNRAMFYPWAQNPNFTATVEEDQDLAAERAWAWGLVLDLDHLGVRGLSVALDRTRAYVARPELGMAHKAQWESQAILDYAFRGTMDGLKLRLLGAWVESSLSSGSIFGQDYHDHRAILSYHIATTARSLVSR